MQQRKNGRLLFPFSWRWTINALRNLEFNFYFKNNVCDVEISLYDEKTKNALSLFHLNNNCTKPISYLPRIATSFKLSALELKDKYAAKRRILLLYSSALIWWKWQVLTQYSVQKCYVFAIIVLLSARSKVSASPMINYVDPTQPTCIWYLLSYCMLLLQ